MGELLVRAGRAEARNKDSGAAKLGSAAVLRSRTPLAAFSPASNPIAFRVFAACWILALASLGGIDGTIRVFSSADVDPAIVTSCSNHAGFDQQLLTNDHPETFGESGTACDIDDDDDQAEIFLDLPDYFSGYLTQSRATPTSSVIGPPCALFLALRRFRC